MKLDRLIKRRDYVEKLMKYEVPAYILRRELRMLLNELSPAIEELKQEKYRISDSISTFFK